MPVDVTQLRTSPKPVQRLIFAAKLRVSRAVLGWSKTELGHRVGLSQRAVHMIDQAETEPRPLTVRRIEEFWGDMGLDFDHRSDGGLRLTVHASALMPRPMRSTRHAMRIANKSV